MECLVSYGYRKVEKPAVLIYTYWICLEKPQNYQRRYYDVFRISYRNLLYDVDYRIDWDLKLILSN